MPKPAPFSTTTSAIEGSAVQGLPSRPAFEKIVSFALSYLRVPPQ